MLCRTVAYHAVQNINSYRDFAVSNNWPPAAAGQLDPSFGPAYESLFMGHVYSWILHHQSNYHFWGCSGKQGPSHSERGRHKFLLLR